VFKISTNGALTTLHSFIGYTFGSDGVFPSGLAQGGDGNFYGTTEAGGTYGLGTIFQISTTAFTTLYSFTGTNDDGSNPYAGLVQGSDGYFYGTTGTGGMSTSLNKFGQAGDGTVFKISTNGVLTSLYSFTGGHDGSGPGGLVQGSDGNFYGTTGGGGANDLGTVFVVNTDGSRFATLYRFSMGSTNSSGFYTNSDGAYPQAALVQGSDGNFYGTTSQGGTNGLGTVFRLTIVPEFQAVTLTNGTLSLTWSTEAGATYQLQYNSELNSTNWINLNSPITATGASLTTTDSVTNAPQRFYRLAISP